MQLSEIMIKNFLFLISKYKALGLLSFFIEYNSLKLLDIVYSLSKNTCRVNLHSWQSPLFCSHVGTLMTRFSAVQRDMGVRKVGQGRAIASSEDFQIELTKLFFFSDDAKKYCRLRGIILTLYAPSVF